MKREEAIKALEYCFDVINSSGNLVVGRDPYEISDIYIDTDDMIYVTDKLSGYHADDIAKIKYSMGRDGERSKVYIVFEDCCELEFDDMAMVVFNLYTQDGVYRGEYDNMDMVYRLWECKQQATSDFLIIDKTLHSYMGNDSQVVIPEGIEVIGEYAFSESKIEEVEIPDSVKRIELEAFSSCEQLAQVRLPKGLEEIESKVFWGCDELTAVTIPESVERIGSHAFEAVANLRNVYILGKNTKLEEKAIDRNVSVHRI